MGRSRVREQLNNKDSGRQATPKAGTRSPPERLRSDAELHPNSKKLVARRFEVSHQRNCSEGVPQAPDFAKNMRCCYFTSPLPQPVLADCPNSPLKNDAISEAEFPFNRI